MKKGNILIAAIAVLAATSVAKAEEIKVDFDGGLGNKCVLFSAALSGETLPDSDSLPIPPPIFSAVLEKVGEGRLSSSQIDSIIREDMEGAERSGKKLIAATLKNLLSHGKDDEKQAYVSVVGRYVFPEKFVPLENIGILKDTWTYGPEYLESETESLQISGAEVCRSITKRFCRLACRMAAGLSSSYGDCRTECRNVIEKSCDHLESPKK